MANLINNWKLLYRQNNSSSHQMKIMLHATINSTPFSLKKIHIRRKRYNDKLISYTKVLQYFKK